MREAGFRLVNLSPGEVVGSVCIPSADDQAQAVRLNLDWDRQRKGVPTLAAAEKRYPHGSIGDGYLRAMALHEQQRQLKGIAWSKEQHSSDDWPRAWRWIEPIFGDCDPKTVSPEQLFGDSRRPDLIGLRPLVAPKVSESEAHRVVKVWRALWNKMAAFGYTGRNIDPSLASPNSSPQPRQAEWREGEVVQLVKTAWRDAIGDLRHCLQLPGTVSFRPSTRAGSPGRRSGMIPRVPGSTFPAKTGRRALATFSRRTERLLSA